MATPAQVQAQLDTENSGTHSTILQAILIPGGLVVEYYVNSIVDAIGRARWVVCNQADSAATQAAAILTKLREG